MPENKVQIIITTDASGAVTGFKLTEDAAGKSTKKIEADTASFSSKVKAHWLAISAAAIAAYAAINKAGEYMKLAAHAQQAEETFRSLAESHGMNADSLLSNLKRVTAGTIEESALMQRALKAISLDLDEKVIVGLGEAARVAARTMGTSVKEAYDRILDSIATGMPRALKHTLLVTKEEMAELNKAFSSGLDPGQFQEIMAQIVAVNAVIKGFEMQGRKSFNSASEAIQRHEVAWEEMKETIGDVGLIVLPKVVGVLMWVASTFLLVSAAVWKTNEALARFNALTLGGVSDKAKKYWGDRADYFKEAANAAMKLRESTISKGATMLGLETGTSGKTYTKAQYDAALKQRAEIDKQLKGLGLKDTKDEIDGIDNAMLEWQRKIEALNPAVSKAENQMADLRTEAIKLFAVLKQKGVDTGFIPGDLEKAQGYIDAAELEKSNDAAAKAYGEDYAEFLQNLKAKESLDRELTRSMSSELEKRLLEVDNWAKDEEDISYKLYEADGISWEEHEKNRTTITQAAADQRKQIIIEVNRAIEEAEIQHQLALVDIQEKNFSISETEAVEKRLSLYQSELDKLKEGYEIASQIKGNDQARRDILRDIDVLQGKITDELQKQKELTGTFEQGMSEGIKSYFRELDPVFKQGFDLAKDSLTSLQDTVSSFSFDAMQGKLKSFSDYWMMLLSSIEKKLADMLAQWMLFGESGGGGGGGGGLSGLIIGLFSGGSGTMPADIGMGIGLAGHSGGYVTKYGIIPTFHFGGLSTNEVPAILQRGEYVVSRRGVDALDKINRGDIQTERQSSPIIVNMYVNAMDAQSFRGYVMQNKKAIADAIMSAGGDNHPVRRYR